MKKERTVEDFNRYFNLYVKIKRDMDICENIRGKALGIFFADDKMAIKWRSNLIRL